MKDFPATGSFIHKFTPKSNHKDQVEIAYFIECHLLTDELSEWEVKILYFTKYVLTIV